MRRPPFILTFILATVVLLITACGDSDPTSTSTPAPQLAVALTATPTLTATTTPTASPTATPMPTSTPTPMATPMLTPMPTGTMTPTAIPTPTATPTPTPTTTPTPGSDITLEVNAPEVSGFDVSINGFVDAEGEVITNMIWVWDDGFSNDSWFPAEHTYDAPGRYEVTVIAFDNLGRSKSIKVIAVVESQATATPTRPAPTGTPLPPDYVTVLGAYSGFYSFPKRFFEGSALSPEQVLKVTDAQYLSLKKMHNGISPYGFGRIEYEPSHYGSTMPDGLKLGDAAFPDRNSGHHRWEVMAHEQGHNFFGGTSAFYYSLAAPGAFLQESLAVLSAFYTFQDILANQQNYGVSSDAIRSLSFDFTNGRAYQESRYQAYLDQDTMFNVNDVLISQALDFKMITYGEQYGWSNIERLAKAFTNDLGGQFTFQNDGTSAVEQSTYIIAALNAAFRRDFRQEFRDLSFPIDDALFDKLFPVISAYLN